MSTPSTPTREVLTVAEAAEILRISRWAVSDLIREGRIPAFRLGRRYRIPAASIDALLTATEPPRHTPSDQA